MLWKQKHGSNATYSALITVFEDAGCREYADEIRKIVQVIQNQDSDTDDSDSDEDPFPLTQPQTYPNLETPPPVVPPSPKPLPCESYLFVEPENLPEGRIYLWQSTICMIYCLATNIGGNYIGTIEEGT